MKDSYRQQPREEKVLLSAGRKCGRAQKSVKGLCHQITQSRIRKEESVCVCTRAHTLMLVCIYVCMYVCMYVCLRVFMCVCLSACLWCVCVSVCSSVCLCVCV